MQLGISTYSFPWSFGVKDNPPAIPYNYKDLLLIACEKGVRNVQFGDNYPLHELTKEQLADLKQTAEQSKLNVELGTKGLTVSNVTKYLEIALMLNAGFLRIVIDETIYRPSKEQVIQTVNQLLPAIRQAKVQLIIENHDRFSSQTLIEIIKSTDPTLVGICLDTANSLGAGEGIHEVVKVLGPYAVNLHVKDFVINRVETNMGFTVRGCAAGEGMLDIPWLLREMSQFNRCKTATLELWPGQEETLEATINQERMWADKSINYLKNLIQ